uniref:Putative secreted mucin n=1 Tax=Amblyomma triste TaxID=251400 RepID=A0A023G2Z3_AMBTT
MASRLAGSCFLVMLTAFTLQQCIISTALPYNDGTVDSGATRKNTPQPKSENDPCDGNEDCGPGLCCVRPDIDNGTICFKLGSSSEECSNTQLQAATAPPAPACRADDDSTSVNVTTHSPPYDVKCPCAEGLDCLFSQIKSRSGSDQEQSVTSTPLGKCETKPVPIERNNEEQPTAAGKDE